METKQTRLDMKKGLTLIEIIVALTIGITIFLLIFSVIRGGGNFTTEEWLIPEQSKARYQREMVEELRRSNDLKEQEDKN